MCGGADLTVRGRVNEVDISSMGALVYVHQAAHIGKLAIDSNAQNKEEAQQFATYCHLMTESIPVHLSEPANLDTCTIATNFVDGNPNSGSNLPPLDKWSV